MKPQSEDSKDGAFAKVYLIGLFYFLEYSQHAPKALTFLSVFLNRPLTFSLIKPFIFPATLARHLWQSIRKVTHDHLQLRRTRRGSPGSTLGSTRSHRLRIPLLERFRVDIVPIRSPGETMS